MTSAAGQPDPTDGAIGTLAFAWFPAGDYERATTLWPDFAGSDAVAGPDGPRPHPQYCQTMQTIFGEYLNAGGSRMTMAPVRVAPFTAWCAEHGQHPNSPEARAAYAAHLAVERDPALVAWPPGRNEPCWCGSGLKYKKCCAATASGDTKAHR